MKPIMLIAAALFGLFASFGSANAAPALNGYLSSPAIVDVQSPGVEKVRRGRCRRVCTRRRGVVRCRTRGRCRRWDGRSRRPRGCFNIGPVWYCP